MREIKDEKFEKKSFFFICDNILMHVTIAKPLFWRTISLFKDKHAKHGSSLSFLRLNQANRQPTACTHSHRERFYMKSLPIKNCYE